MTQQATTPTTYVDAAPPWGFGAWFAVISGVVVEAPVALAVVLFVKFAVGTTCRLPATMSNVGAGEIALSVVLVLGFVPWAAAIWVGRQRRVALAIAAALALSPVLGAMVAAVRPEFWVGNFCL